MSYMSSLMRNNSLTTPILLITFNRPNHTRRVLEAIMKSQPSELFVFQDGERTDNEEDHFKCEAVKRVVEESIATSNIVLHKYYSPINLGCGAGPITGIQWFFNHVEKGIVMEDDCLPHPDFFGYCDELLTRYADDDKIRFINATLYNNRWKCEASYDFSRYMVTGAWAAWRRSFEGFDLDLLGLDAKKLRKHVLKLTDNRGEANWWYSIVREIQQDTHKKSYWDFQMQIHLFRSNAFTIHPERNLITNIGFDAEGTHTINNDDQRGGQPVFPILPLTHPSNQVIDKKRDAFCWAKAQSRGFIKDEIEYLYQQLFWSKGICRKLLLAYRWAKKKGAYSNKI